MINLSAVFLDPAICQPFTYERAGESASQEGELVVGAAAVLDAIGSIQPANPGDLKKYLPEGARNTAYIKIFTGSVLQIADGVSTRSDVVVWQGRRYVVEQLRRWDDYGYTQALAGRL